MQRSDKHRDTVNLIEKVNFSFDILEKLEEKNLLHIRDQIFGALDDRDIHNVKILSF